ncbi:MAG: YceI family protein [Desertimonas sp.]
MSIPSGTYNVDPAHSRIGFVARHAMVTKVRGAFMAFQGSGTFDAADPSASSMQLTIDAPSIDTGNTDRDAHLRGNDFFDMDTYPEITFASTAVTTTGDGTYDVTGDLTMKGTTKSVTVPFEVAGPAKDPFGNTRIGLEGSVQVNRKDWGLSWNAPLETGGLLLSEKVTLEFDVAAVLST